MTYLLVTLGGILTGWSISSAAGAVQSFLRSKELGGFDDRLSPEELLEWDRFTSGGRRG